MVSVSTEEFPSYFHAFIFLKILKSKMVLKFPWYLNKEVQTDVIRCYLKVRQNYLVEVQ